MDPSTLTPYDPGRHQGNANVAFVDSHVETLALHRLFADPSDEALAAWNRDGQPHRARWDYARPAEWERPRPIMMPIRWFTKRDMR